LKDLLERLEWGIDKDSARRLFPSFTCVGDHPTENGIGFIGKIFGRPAFMVCYLEEEPPDQHRLSRLIIIFTGERPDDETCARIFAEIGSEITTLLDRPPYEVARPQDLLPESHLTRMSVWRRDQTVITVSLALAAEAVDPSSPPIALSIGDVDNDPATQRWSWLEP
jgi:hypothetical protein